MIDRWFISSVRHGDYIYWMTELEGHLMRMHLTELNVEILNPVNYCSILDRSAAALICECKGIIYGFVQYGEYLIRYDVSDNRCEYIKTGLADLELNMIASVGVYSKFIYMFPCIGSVVLKMDTETGSIEVMDARYESLKNKRLRRSRVQIGSQLMLVPKDYDKALLFDMSDESFCEEKYPNDFGEVFCVAQAQEKIYVLTGKRDVYCWDIATKTNDCLFNNHGIISTDYLCALMHIRNDHIWLMPSRSDDIICIDLDSWKVDVYENYPTDFEYNAPNSANMGKYTYGVSLDSCDIPAMHCGNYIFVIDNNGEGAFVEAKWPTIEDEANYLSDINRSFFYEGRYTLSNYLGLVSQRGKDRA